MLTFDITYYVVCNIYATIILENCQIVRVTASMDNVATNGS